MPQINLKISDDLNARIESEAGGKRERAGWIRELIRDELGADTDAKPDEGHYPEKDRDRKIYESLLRHGGDAVLKGYVDLEEYEPEIAVDTRVSEDAIYGSLKRMEKHNHVRLDHGIYAGDSVRVRARPPSADPDQWTRAKDRKRTLETSVYRFGGPRRESSAQRKLLEEIEAADEDTTHTEAVADD